MKIAEVGHLLRKRGVGTRAPLPWHATIRILTRLSAAHG